MDKAKKTMDLYGFLWTRSERDDLYNNSHFDNMQQVITEPIVRGSMGIDIGSGCGYDTYIMAKRNPLVKIISLDISDGVYKTKQLTYGLNNVRVIKGSVLNLPIKNDTFDFAYSFGVLHHTREPEYGLREINRIIKKDAPAFLYLYEDHSENSMKHYAIKIISIYRIITTKIPQRILYFLCYLASPFIVLAFSYPSRILRKFKATQSLSQKIPFNFGTHLFSVAGDLYDRFGAPIEQRFSEQEAYNMFIKCNFYNVYITRLRDAAGWVIWAHKNK